MKLSQKGVVHLLLLIILLGGLAVGVYLVSSGNPLKLFSRATNLPIVFKNIDGTVLPLNAQGIPQSNSATVKVELTSTLAQSSPTPIGIGNTAPIGIGTTASGPLPTVTPIPSSIKLLSPNGGEAFGLNQIVNIRWEATGCDSYYLTAYDKNLLAFAVTSMIKNPDTKSVAWNTSSITYPGWGKPLTMEIWCQKKFIYDWDMRMVAKDTSDGSFMISTAPSPAPTPTLTPSPTPTSTPVSSQTFNFQTGWNFVGLTLDKGSGYKARDFITDLVNGATPKLSLTELIDQIGMYTGGGWNAYLTALGPEQINNFIIKPGAGYMIKAKQPFSSTLSASASASLTSLRYGPSWNPISFVKVPQKINSQSKLLNEIKSQGGQISPVFTQVFRVKDGKWDSGTDFPIEAGEGYFINFQNRGTFNLPSSDTKPLSASKSYSALANLTLPSVIYPSPQPTVGPTPTPSPNLISQSLILGYGNNLIGLTVDKGSSYLAEDFLKDLNKSTPGNNKIYRIYKTDPATNRNIIHSLGTTSNNFPINVGEGYFVVSNNWRGTVTISGTAPQQTTITIPRGNSLISFWQVPSNLNKAEPLLQAMKAQGIQVTTIAKFQYGFYQGHPIGYPFNNFVIQPGIGYSIKNNGDTKIFQLSLPPAASARVGRSGILGVGTSNPTPTTPISYRIAETPTELDNAAYQPYYQDPTVITYTFKDPAPGQKFLWVEFKTSDGRTDRKSAQIEVVSVIPSPTPTITPKPYDLDVVYIERTPRYPRYCLYNNGGVPGICSGTENVKHNPAEGDSVTFKAKVVNKGNNQTGNFNYQWLIDGAEVQKGQSAIPSSGESSILSYNWVWKNGDHKVKFVVTNPSGVTELTQVNNQLEDYNNALSFRLHVEKSVYDKFNSLENIIGTKSFEDWAQYQLKKMGDLMAEVGGKEHFRIDEIVIEDDNTLPRVAEHAPLDMDWDGRWGFETTEWMTDPNKITTQVKVVPNDLIHEWGHQMGLIDSYNLNYDWNDIKNNLVIPQCKDFPQKYANGVNIDAKGTIYEKCMYYTPNDTGIMNYTAAGKFSTFNAQALNTNLGYRRGYFGEYLYDIPSQNSIRVIDRNNNPLAEAQVSFYQSQGCGDKRSIPNQIAFSGITDKDGKFNLPNRSAKAVTTATGHTQRNNPFGTIDVVGCNGVFLIKIEANNQTGYQWLDIASFNLEYWKGNTQNAEYIIKVSLAPQPPATSVPTPTPTPTSAPFVCTACSADINKDKNVNITDFSILSSCYNQKPESKCVNADITKDGNIDIQDYNCLRTQFGRQCL